MFVLNQVRRTLALVATAAVITTGAISPAAASTFEGCGPYVIMGCFKSVSAARERAGNGFLIIRTRDYPNLRNGWFCAAEGPFDSRSQANSFLFQIKSNVPDAYVKNGC